MHPDQISVSAATVRTLVEEQFPAWRTLPIEPVPSSGTVNAIFRIGTELAARFPLRPTSVDTVRGELAAAGELLDRTAFPTPAPVALGEPGPGYPFPWSVQTWLSGTVATEDDPGSSVDFALDLASLIRDLRAIDTRGRFFTGPGRGGALPAHDAWVAECLSRSEGLLDVPRLRDLWRSLRTLPRVGTDVMTHGDLIPGNILVHSGRLAGVLDVGGLGPADPALDLLSAWHLLEAEPRAALRASLGCDDLEWERGRAWALQQALGMVWYYVDSNPTMSHLGRRTLDRIMKDLPKGR